MTFPKASNHPPTCTVCGGSGWQGTAPIPYRANGDDGTYTMWEPCTHHWTDDDPTPPTIPWLREVDTDRWRITDRD